MVTDADSDAFDAMVGSWLMRSLLSEPAAQGMQGDDSAGLVLVRLDGKTVRDGRDSQGNKRHLLATLVGRTAPSSAQINMPSDRFEQLAACSIRMLVLRQPSPPARAMEPWGDELSEMSSSTRIIISLMNC